MRLAATGDTTPAAGDRRADQLPADLRVHRRGDAQLDAADVLNWATAGDRRNRARRSDGTPRCWSKSTSTRSAFSTTPICSRHWSRSRTSAPGQQRRAGRHLDQEAEEGKAREGREARRRRRSETKSETAKQRKEIREKLQKFLAKIPVFMYVTDFREEALKDVIESLDPTCSSGSPGSRSTTSGC